ncbi:efflux RND transporter periplasmic adaptor subunit [Sulfurimonas sp. SAG-AH-194-C21]|nr:efflux RND transporter periplasmic adaptor subunit [Sulfurimonas sp. SAG-AH-194-C21]MDF1883180.1 efflux RND transporter periplasmic adaptor subunit [Sulfurimonas sp. SAG-AH-194-C21]
MNKLLLITLTLASTLFATEIPTAKVEVHKFNKSVELNAQVIQLSNAQQSITSLVAGHLEKYYVKPAQKVAEGQKVALIESIIVSKMSANYLALKKQLGAVSKNYTATKELYEKGMTSMQELNNQEIKKSEINAQLTALESQLDTLGIDAASLKKATANFILRAHSSGVVSALLKPLHSSVNVSDAILSIVKNQAYYVKSFLPIEYATKVNVGDKIVVKYAQKNIITHITQILPTVDEVTQRVVVLSSVDEKIENLFLGTYLKSTVYFGDALEHMAVKKSALSFFNNEWVVFVPKMEEEHHEAEAGHDEHSDEKHEDEDHDEHGEEAGHDDHEEGEGEHHEEHEAAYTLTVVKIIAEDEDYVAVEGLDLNAEYVSDKSYYVKSMILKGSLGGHGH